jgi:ATP-dependent Clp protease ATP-binding subunit ClpA
MFDRFTDRARKVMGYARQEAERLNHDYIGTEHILLGLVKEGSGVAANVLENLEVDLDKVRAEVERSAAKGPDGLVQDQLPFNNEAKRALDGSLEATRRLHYKYVGTEHILLGLLGVEDCVAAQVLVSLGLSLEVARQEVVELLGGRGGPLLPGVGLFASEPTLAPRVIRAIHYAVEAARKAGAPLTDIEHVRAGLDRAEMESGEKSG